MITFVETPLFTRSLRRHLDDDEYRALQLALLLDPEVGRLIAGSAGLRKLRWRGTGRGKRGGLRLIYFWIEKRQLCYLLYLYAKNEQGDLTAAQTRTLAQLARDELE